MIKSTPYKFRILYLLFFVLVFLVGFPILVFYSAGYTLDETFGLSARGGIYIFTPEPATNVFIGNESKGTSSFFQKEILISRLKPDKYLVLVANDKFWPWAKFVDVEAGEVEAMFPLLVPKVINVVEVKPKTADYIKIGALFKPSVVIGIATTSNATTTIIRKKVKVWIDGQRIVAEWRGSANSAPKYFCVLEQCIDPILVFQSSVQVRYIDFYPLRDDAIILALDNGIYAVEIDHRTYQNFYPIYRGQSPDFRVNDNIVYIKDNEYIATIEL